MGQNDPIFLVGIPEIQATNFLGRSNQEQSGHFNWTRFNPH